MEVPPEIWPTLKVVRGSDGKGSEATSASAWLRSTMGLGAPASVHEWPPGPDTVTRRRTLPSARVTTADEPPPSSAIAPEMRSRYGPRRKRCLMPRRSPSPSSPTFATKRIVAGGVIAAKSRAAAIASSAVKPAPLSEDPGARIRDPISIGSQTVPGGNTVSRCAESSSMPAARSAEAPRRSPTTLPSSSIWTLSRPKFRKRSSNHSALSRSPKGGAGIRTISSSHCRICG